MNPIALANLPTSTAQEVFDWVTVNLLIQGEKSMDRDSRRCLLHHNRLRCAAGWCIADEEYHPRFERGLWVNLAAEGLVPDNHMDLIDQLQGVHDRREPDEWREEFKKIARTHGVVFKEPK
jgi:hypothetical protein